MLPTILLLLLCIHFRSRGETVNRTVELFFRFPSLYLFGRGFRSKSNEPTKIG